MASLGLEKETLRLTDLSGTVLLSHLTHVWENRPFHRKEMVTRVATLKKLAAGNPKAIRKLLSTGSSQISSKADVDHFIKEFALQKSISSLEQKIRGDNLRTNY